MRRTSLALPIALATLTIATQSGANGDDGRVEIHGYGGWSYARSNSDDNRYLGSSKDGDADYLNVAVLFAATASDRVRINTQIWWQESEHEEGTSVVDFAFAEYRFSDALRLRAGKVKHPFGIYTEVFDVGTLRPFFWLPQGIYGPSGVVSEAYRGIGATGSTFPLGAWRLEYDLYTGEMSLDAPSFASLLAAATGTAGEGEPAEAEEGVELRDLAGGRIVVTVPASDIRLGLSAYTARMEEGDRERHSSVGALVEYLDDGWSFRGEYVFLKESPTVDATQGYLELARHLGESWQIAGRVDHSQTRLDGLDAGDAASLLDHRELTAGLNYWFQTDFVVKLSASSVDGNRFALPEDPRTAIDDEALARKMRLVSLGVQFAF